MQPRMLGLPPGRIWADVEHQATPCPGLRVRVRLEGIPGSPGVHQMADASRVRHLRVRESPGAALPSDEVH